MLRSLEPISPNTVFTSLFEHSCTFSRYPTCRWLLAHREHCGMQVRQSARQEPAGTDWLRGQRPGPRLRPPAHTAGPAAAASVRSQQPGRTGKVLKPIQRGTSRCCCCEDVISLFHLRLLQTLSGTELAFNCYSHTRSTSRDLLHIIILNCLPTLGKIYPPLPPTQLDTREHTRAT